MIYVAGLGLVLTIVGFYLRSRSLGVLPALLDALAASVCGWTAGLLLGVGARTGMWAIPFFNGVDSRFTFDGTFQVVLTFSLFGIGIALVYEMFFRALLRSRGLLFGLLVTVITAYPLGEAALQQITFDPPVIPAIGFTLLFVGVMFIPYAMALELLLGSYHRIRARGNLAIDPIGTQGRA